MITPETLIDLRQRYGCILSRGAALALCAEIGVGRRVFEERCKASPPGFRFRIGRAVYHKYSREKIIALVIP